MVHSNHVHLTRRERQIMDVLYARGEATAAEVQQSIPDSPSYSAVRALLKKLLDKEHVVYRQQGAKYVYAPALPKSDAKRSAIRRLIDTFFEGSTASAVVNLLGSQKQPLSREDIAAIEAELEKLKAADK